MIQSSMKHIALLLLIGFVVTGAFGFMTMSHENHGSGSCPAAILSGASCSNVASVISHYLSAFLLSAEAVVTHASLLLTVLLALLLALAWATIRFFAPPPARLFVPTDERVPLQPRVLTSFLALFEHSPSFLYRSA